MSQSATSTTPIAIWSTERLTRFMRVQWRPMSSGSRPTRSGLSDATICRAIASAPGPGPLMKLFPSIPSSVSIRRTPIGSRPSVTPNTLRTSVLRSWRTTLTLLIRNSAALDQGPDGDGHDDQASANDVLVEVLHAEEVEAVRDQAEHQHADHGSPDRADTAKDARPAERDPGDRGERERLARRIAG